MDMNEMVSIVVPTYNREQEIVRAIRSILQQTYERYEVIVVDDGSSDRTRDAVRQIQDDRIRYIHCKSNQGAAHARNIGMQESRYEYVAFLDSDDEWMADKLELQMKRIVEAPEEVGIVYCRMGGEMRGSKERYICPPADMMEEVLKGEMFSKLMYRNVIGMPCVLARKKCLEQIGGFKEGLQCLEDWEWILRIAQKWRIEFVDKVLVEVHKSEGSVSTNLGAYLVARCYMVSLYRSEMTEAGILASVREEILEKAKKVNLSEEIGELLNRDFEL